MSRIPCRKCKSCGLVSDFTVTFCECGKTLSGLPVQLIETDDIPVECYGEIAENIPVYVQKCPACGALNFTADKENRVKVCHNCHKSRVAVIEPVPFENADDKEDAGKGAVTNGITAQTNIPKDTTERIRISPAISNDDDDDDDDDESGAVSSWATRLNNIRNAVGGCEPISRTKLVGNTAGQSAFYDDDDDDDDEGETDWSGVLGKKAQPQPKPITPQLPSITFIALRYGQHSFTITPAEGASYMLGRSANQSTFLNNDGRVSNEHCVITLRNGSWFVKDNHSANGTAVNSKDIGLNGERELHNGDALKLGHHPDSMEFRITIL